MKIYQSPAVVKWANKLTETVWDIGLDCPEIISSALPGQFVNISIPGFFLRRPISVCEIKDGALRLIFEVRGKGTSALADMLKENITFDLLGPLGGRGFAAHKYRSALLVGGGIGVPPLKFCQNVLPESAALLGFRDSAHVIMADEFKNVTVCTDDGSYGYHGNISAPLRELLQSGKFDVIMACGPKPMLRAVIAAADEFGLPAEVSLEERMACGVGACLGCACKTVKDGKEFYSHVCKDGPVFDKEAVIL